MITKANDSLGKEPKRFTATALAAVAVAQTLAVAIDWNYWLLRPGHDVKDWAYVLGGVAYLALSLIARSTPLAALTAATAMHVYFMILIEVPAVGYGGHWVYGRALQTPILIILCWAWWGEINIGQHRMKRPEIRAEPAWRYLTFLFFGLLSVFGLAWACTDLGLKESLTIPPGLPDGAIAKLSKGMSLSWQDATKLVRRMWFDTIVVGISAFVLGLCLPPILAVLARVGKGRALGESEKVKGVPGQSQ